MAERMASEPITVELSFTQQSPTSLRKESNDIGSKSPGKSKKKLLKGSLFRRTSSQDSPSVKFERSSSRGKKKSSRDSKSGTSSRESLDLLDGPNESRAPPFEADGQRSTRTFESQEVEEKSVAELSAKKVHKLNQELLKHNSQLTKSVDSLKKERADLLSQKQKLQGERKVLVKELRRVSSKGETRHAKPNLNLEDEGDSDERLQHLEGAMSTRDKKLGALRSRLERLQKEMEGSQFWDDDDPPSNDSPPTKVNGCHSVDASAALARLEEEKTLCLKLREENKELHSKMATLEAELDHVHKELADSNPRKKTGSSFFKRGKRHTSSMFVRSSDDVSSERAKAELRRSKSPEPIDSSHTSSQSKLDLKPATSSPNLSPRMRRRQSSNPDLKTLQSCLKIAIEEKKTYEEKNKQLEDELQQLKNKVVQLERAMAESERKKVPEPSSPETEQLKKKLRMAVSEKTSLSSQCEKLRKELGDLKSRNKSLEQNVNTVQAKKDSVISELEEEREKLQKDLAKAKEQLAEAKAVATKVHSQSISASKPQNDSPSVTAKKQSEPPSKWAKETPTAKVDKAKESTDAPKQQDSKPGSLMVRTSGRVSSPASSLGSPSKGAKVLAARAMFEDKDSSKVEPGSASPRPYQKTWSVEGQQRRSSLTNGPAEANAHTKPNSPPATPTTSGAKVSKIKVTSSVSPTASPVLNVRKEVKEITVRSPRTEKREQSFTYITPKTASVTSGATASPAHSPSVSRVVVNSSTTSSTATPAVRTPGSVRKGIESKWAQFEAKSGPSKVMWPSSYYGANPQISEPPKTSVTQASSKPKEEKVVVRRMQSALNVPTMTSPVKKASSMLSIPENIAADSSSSSSSSGSSVSTVVEADSKKIVSSRSPVAHRIQRRERKDRPKTMYATRSETVSLVKLISRVQEEEKEKREREIEKIVSTEPATTRVVNGTSSPTSVNAPRRAPSPVQLRSHPSPRQPRPNTYYGGGHTSYSSPNFSSRQTSYEKPKPEERKLLRANTVAFGIGAANKQSKKANLLRWCQFVTQEYDNVHIGNFGESFASGMAFCALLHHFIPEKIPYSTLSHTNREQNFRVAFESAESVGIPSLLDVEDMVALPIPDWMSVMTYISFIYNKFGKQSSNGVS